MKNKKENDGIDNIINSIHITDSFIINPQKHIFYQILREII